MLISIYKKVAHFYYCYSIYTSIHMPVTAWPILPCFGSLIADQQDSQFILCFIRMSKNPDYCNQFRTGKNIQSTNSLPLFVQDLLSLFSLSKMITCSPLMKSTCKFASGFGKKNVFRYQSNNVCLYKMHLPNSKCNKHTVNSSYSLIIY